MKPLTLVLAPLAGLALIASACGAPHISLHPAYTYDTAITVSTPPVRNPSPVTAWAAGDRLYEQMVFQTLLSLNPHGHAVPELAQSWSHNAAGTIWHFTLNPFAKWWSGRPITAQNVVWTLNFYRNPESGFVDAGELRSVVRVKEVSRTALEIVLKHPELDFAADTLTPRGGIWILPSFLLTRLAPSQVRTSGYLTDTKDLMGSGPFRPIQVAPGTVTWVAYPRYFLGAPKTKYLRWVWSRRDQGAAIDIAATYFPSSRFERNYRSLTEKSTTLWYLTATSRFWLTVVRKATNAALLPGIPAYSTGWNPESLTRYGPYSPGQLDALLARRGYRRTPQFWVGADGTILRITLAEPHSAFGRRLAQVLAKEWQARGFRVELVPSGHPANIRLRWREAAPTPEPLPPDSHQLVWAPQHWYVRDRIADFTPNVWQLFYKAASWRVRSHAKPVAQ